MATLDDVAQHVPLKRRVAAAKRVIATSADLDADGRKAILAMAIWPDGLPRGAIPHPIPAPYGRCANPYCDAPLPEPPPKLSRPRLYCSRRCAGIARRVERRPAQRTCAECGQSFQPATWRSRYCCNSCRWRAGNRDRARQYREARAGVG